MLVLLAGVGLLAYRWFNHSSGRTSPTSQPAAEINWTPEMVAQKPVEYLDWYEGKLNSSLAELKARAAKIAQSRTTVQGLLADAKQKLALANVVEGDLVAAYRDAEKSSAWPVTWQGEPRTQSWMQQNITDVHIQGQGKTTLISRLTQALPDLDSQDDTIVQTRGKVLAELSNVKADREIAKLQNLSQEMAQEWASRPVLMDPTFAAARNNSGIVHLDELKTPAGSEKNVDFNKIISQP